MEAKDTVMNSKDNSFLWDKLWGNRFYGDVRQLLYLQAEITWKARDQEIEAARKAGYEQGYIDGTYDGLQRQQIGAAKLKAEIVEAKKAGMKKVVDWINKEPTGQPYSMYPGFILISPERQTQLKLWFKDEPELLKKWGIK